MFRLIICFVSALACWLPSNVYFWQLVSNQKNQWKGAFTQHHRQGHKINSFQSSCESKCPRKGIYIQYSLLFKKEKPKAWKKQRKLKKKNVALFSTYYIQMYMKHLKLCSSGLDFTAMALVAQGVTVKGGWNWLCIEAQVTDVKCIRWKVSPDGWISPPFSRLQQFNFHRQAVACYWISEESWFDQAV